MMNCRIEEKQKQGRGKSSSDEEKGNIFHCFNINSRTTRDNEEHDNARKETMNV